MSSYLLLSSMDSQKNPKLLNFFFVFRKCNLLVSHESLPSTVLIVSVWWKSWFSLCGQLNKSTTCYMCQSRSLQMGMDDLWKTLKSRRKVSVLFHLGYLTCMKTWLVNKTWLNKQPLCYKEAMDYCVQTQKRKILLLSQTWWSDFLISESQSPWEGCRNGD